MSERNGNIPTTTASTAVLDALRALGSKKISLATPYPEELVKLQEDFLEKNGIEVLHKTWIREGTTSDSEISTKAIYNLARESNEDESEAIFISCVGLQTLELIERLEEDLNKPVVTSVQATMWRLIKLAEINAKIRGFGKLFHIEGGGYRNEQIKNPTPEGPVLV